MCKKFNSSLFIWGYYEKFVKEKLIMHYLAHIYINYGVATVCRETAPKKHAKIFTLQKKPFDVLANVIQGKVIKKLLISKMSYISFHIYTIPFI